MFFIFIWIIDRERERLVLLHPLLVILGSSKLKILKQHPLVYEWMCVWMGECDAIVKFFGVMVLEKYYVSAT